MGIGQGRVGWSLCAKGEDMHPVVLIFPAEEFAVGAVFGVDSIGYGDKRGLSAVLRL